MRRSKVQWILFAACLVLCPLVASAETPDIDRFWTTVGSAGTLDEKSEGKVFFDHAVVQKGVPLVVSQSRQLRANASGGVDVTDSATIRYNVVAVDGLFAEHMLGMTVRFLDTGEARVVAKLIEVNVSTGDEVTRLTFDSDDFPAQNGYQEQAVDALFDCEKRPEPFDFVKNAYYIEATLTTSAVVANSAAGIQIIQLNTTPCIRS